jgi:hypothetical protein
MTYAQRVMHRPLYRLFDAFRGANNSLSQTVDDVRREIDQLKKDYEARIQFGNIRRHLIV